MNTERVIRVSYDQGACITSVIRQFQIDEGPGDHELAALRSHSWMGTSRSQDRARLLPRHRRVLAAGDDGSGLPLPLERSDEPRTEGRQSVMAPEGRSVLELVDGPERSIAGATRISLALA